MHLITIIQVLFYLHVTRISAAGSGDSHRRAMTVLEALENTEFFPDETFKADTFQRPEQNYMRSPDKGSDIFKVLFDNGYSDHRNLVQIKPKRGWEDLNMAWRKSPKRAWEVVNRLWRMPDIRRRYSRYINNGKRSKEVMKDIPVQQDNKNPMWMIDEIGYDTDFNNPSIDNWPRDEHSWHLNNLKRGWEAIGPFRSVNWRRSLSDRRLKPDTISKRGWEDISWKRSNAGIDRDALDASQKEAYGGASNFDYNITPKSDEETDEQKMTNLPSDFIDIVIPDFYEQLKKSPGSLFDEGDDFEIEDEEPYFANNLNNLDQYEKLAPTEWDKETYRKKPFF